MAPELGLQRSLDTQLAQTVLALLFTAGCVALVFGFTRLVHGNSALGWITRSARALWRTHSATSGGMIFASRFPGSG